MEPRMESKRRERRFWMNPVTPSWTPRVTRRTRHPIPRRRRRRHRYRSNTSRHPGSASRSPRSGPSRRRSRTFPDRAPRVLAATRRMRSPARSRSTPPNCPARCWETAPWFVTCRTTASWSCCPTAVCASGPVSLTRQPAAASGSARTSPGHAGDSRIRGTANPGSDSSSRRSNRSRTRRVTRWWTRRRVRRNSRRRMERKGTCPPPR
mmetsp:Transcript_10254/g.28622  ORF Transcript_10254/g.28622 Transcript_10254/m.28622 type:complete len:208 (-) Transcript_10254:2121-2744(-)